MDLMVQGLNKEVLTKYMDQACYPSFLPSFQPDYCFTSCPAALADVEKPES